MSYSVRATVKHTPHTHTAHTHTHTTHTHNTHTHTHTTHTHTHNAHTHTQHTHNTHTHNAHTHNTHTQHTHNTHTHCHTVENFGSKKHNGLVCQTLLTKHFISCYMANHLSCFFPIELFAYLPEFYNSTNVS